jgi:hypothetical protein
MVYVRKFRVQSVPKIVIFTQRLLYCIMGVRHLDHGLLDVIDDALARA